MADFEKAFEKTLKLEGGYSNNPLDSGGETMWGITEATARGMGYQGEMRKLPLALAKKFYKTGYWDSILLDRVTSQVLAENLFDCAVNCGTGTSVRFLQRALNVLNDREKKWNDIEKDGIMGQKTLGAAQSALNSAGGETALVKLFNGLRVAYYVEIAEKREKNEAFVLGWILHRILLEVKR